MSAPAPPVPGRPSARARTPRRLWMTGSMGSGKTTVGRALAQVLAWPYLDNDEQLVTLTGRRAAAIAEHDGAKALHDAVRNLAESFFARAVPLVAGLPASVVDLPRVVADMRASGRVIYLEVPVAVLRDRIGSSDRPRLHGDVAALLSRRVSAFRACADALLDGTASPGVLVADAAALASTWWPSRVDDPAGGDR